MQGQGGLLISGTAITSGNFRDSDGLQKMLQHLHSGPVGSFNQSGNGASGGNNGNCGGDNCRIGGSTGAASYAGNISGGSGGSSSGGGSNGSAGSRGSGGGGGSAQVTAGSSPTNVGVLMVLQVVR